VIGVDLKGPLYRVLEIPMTVREDGDLNALKGFWKVIRQMADYVLALLVGHLSSVFDI
jgi:hypothetical protein